MSGSSHLGKRIVKDLGGTLSHGMVVAYFPKTAEETEVWRVLYTDGTEEDVSEDGLDAFEPINQSKCSSVLQGVAKEWSDIQRKSREKGKEGRKNSERNSPQFDSDSEDNVPLVRRVAGSTGTAASDSLGTNVSGLGGYHIFMSAQLRQLRAEVPSSTRAEKFMRISALWRGMSAEEKEKYAGVARRIIQKRARLAEGEDLGQPSANKKRRAESKSAAATPRNSDARLSPPGAIAQTPEKEAAQDDTEEEDTEEDTPLLTRVAGPCGGQIVASTDDTTKQHGSGSLDKEMRATAEDGGQRASDERSESAPAVHGRRPWSEGLEEGGERIPRTADACAEQTRVHERHHEKVGQPEGEDGSNGARGISASSFPREMQERRAAGVFPQGEGRRDGGDVCDEVGASEGGPASPPPQARPALAGGALPVGEHSRPQSQGKMCEHGRQRSRCKECGGAAICEHGRVRSYCKECGGSAICEHNRQRSRCKECGGASICEHNKRRDQCKECGGSSICEHNKIRNGCTKCRGSAICEHNKQRSRCKECGGSSICEHGSRRDQCKECKGAGAGRGQGGVGAGGVGGEEGGAGGGRGAQATSETLLVIDLTEPTRGSSAESEEAGGSSAAVDPSQQPAPNPQHGDALPNPSDTASAPNLDLARPHARHAQPADDANGGALSLSCLSDDDDDDRPIRSKAKATSSTVTMLAPVRPLLPSAPALPPTPAPPRCREEEGEAASSAPSQPPPSSVLRPAPLRPAPLPLFDAAITAAALGSRAHPSYPPPPPPAQAAPSPHAPPPPPTCSQPLPLPTRSSRTPLPTRSTSRGRAAAASGRRASMAGNGTCAKSAGVQRSVSTVDNGTCAKSAVGHRSVSTTGYGATAGSAGGHRSVSTTEYGVGAKSAGSQRSLSMTGNAPPPAHVQPPPPPAHAQQPLPPAHAQPGADPRATHLLQTNCVWSDGVGQVCVNEDLPPTAGAHPPPHAPHAGFASAAGHASAPAPAPSSASASASAPAAAHASSAGAGAQSLGGVQSMQSIQSIQSMQSVQSIESSAAYLGAVERIAAAALPELLFCLHAALQPSRHALANALHATGVQPREEDIPSLFHHLDATIMQRLATHITHNVGALQALARAPSAVRDTQTP